MLNNKKRIEYYLSTFNHEGLPDKVSSKIFDAPFKLEKGIHTRHTYDLDLNRLYSIAPNTLWVQCGDLQYEGRNKVLVKTRDSFNKKSHGIIAKLNTLRHWNFDLKEDWEWSYKKSDVIWRGSDTGKNLENNDRLIFVKNFYKILNVGFSSWEQNQKIYPSIYRDEYLKNRLRVEDFLKFKYLPVIDGNDKSSSLNWVLASNCLPIMPKPRFHSWACEKFLEPGIHYVECKRDFSDFLDKVDWCKSNDQKAKKIAENGKSFMKIFFYQENENKIEIDLINTVCSNLT